MSTLSATARAESCAVDRPEGMHHVGIVAGEASGDGLGAALIQGLRELDPEIRVTAMAGPRMLEAGCEALASIDALSVMGLVEVLKHYPRLRRLRADLIEGFAAAGIDAFVSIDVPDFSLGMSRRLKARGVPTVHLVCPQVWAWRPGRIPGLRRALDRMLVLFPFEVEFLRDHGLTARFVGHPLADQIPRTPDRLAAREALGLSPGPPVLALLPGSRRQEYTRHLPLFLAAAAALRQRRPGLEVVIGLANARAAEWAAQLPALTESGARLVIGRATEVLTAADVALCVSGTITLEGALCQTPLVVAYRMPWLTYQILRRLVRVDSIALPNLLMPGINVPECIQDAATAPKLAEALDAWLADPDRTATYRARCAALHDVLHRGAGRAAAEAVLELIAAKRRMGQGKPG